MKRWNAHEVDSQSSSSGDVRCVYVLIEMFCVCAKGKGMSHKMYYQRMWAENSGEEQISEGDQLYHSMSQHSSATANRNKYTNVT